MKKRRDQTVEIVASSVHLVTKKNTLHAEKNAKNVDCLIIMRRFAENIVDLTTKVLPLQYQQQKKYKRSG